MLDQQLQGIFTAPSRPGCPQPADFGANVLLYASVDEVPRLQALSGRECTAVSRSQNPEPSERPTPHPIYGPYPVEPAEGHVDGQGEKIAGHFLEGFHQLLLGFPAARQPGLAAQQDAHGDAEHEAFHLGVNQEAALSAAQPLLQATVHFLCDHRHVALERLAAEGLHNHLSSEEERVLKAGPSRPSRLHGAPSRDPQPLQTSRHLQAGKTTLFERVLAHSSCSCGLPRTYLPEPLRRRGSPSSPGAVTPPSPPPHLLALLVRGVVQVGEAARAQDRAHRRRPVDRHEPVFPEQDAPHVVCTHHPHRGPPEQMRLVDETVFPALHLQELPSLREESGGKRRA